MIGKIMVEVLWILGILTKEIGQGRASMFLRLHAATCTSIDVFSESFLRKLIGRKDVEDALRRLDQLTQEEARMAVIEAMKIAHNIGDKVNDVDEKLEGVDHRVLDVSVQVEEVDSKLEIIDRKVQSACHNVVSVVEGRSYLSWPSPDSVIIHNLLGEM